ncbi:MAG: hypothetical protein WA005_06075 [Candidatus Binataceae bacterium]
MSPKAFQGTATGAFCLALLENNETGSFSDRVLKTLISTPISSLKSAAFCRPPIPPATAASRWDREAAAHGDLDAQFNLAYMYQHGQGVPPSHAGAVQWYRKAAAQGDGDAARKLRTMGLD